MKRTDIYAKHSHTISDPESGFTDRAADGHRHRLYSHCERCKKVKRHLAKLMGYSSTEVSDEHKHKWQDDTL